MRCLQDLARYHVQESDRGGRQAASMECPDYREPIVAKTVQSFENSLTTNDEFASDT